MARWSKSPNTVTGPKLWPYTHEENAPILQSPHGLPQGGVRLDEQHLPDDWQNSETVGKELMW